MGGQREKRFWYFTELKDTAELRECRKKYSAERLLNPDLTFPQFAVQYMGRPVPTIADVFTQLKKKGYDPQTPPVKDGSGKVIAQDMSSELYQAVSFWVSKPISEEDSKAVTDLGFELSQ
ncbi:MAG: hypothetical protein HYU56_05070 [Candidatus Aenigmarchaeota archaeon]|nr:hypothetical protein [Candidatus Aenigmarchaeota archaeon]